MTTWITPTGHDDVGNIWDDDILIRDDNEDTFARTIDTWAYENGWMPWLVLTHAAIYCDRVRFDWHGEAANWDMKIDVLYSGTYHNIYEGTPFDPSWIEYPIGSTEKVTAARISFRRLFGEGSYKIDAHEFDFGKVPVVIPVVDTASAFDVEETTALLRCYVYVDGEDCDTVGFDWGYTAAYGSYIGLTNGFESYLYTKTLTGINRGDKVYYRGTAHNSAGDGVGGQLTFITKPNAPASLNASNPTKTTIDVSWAKGDGAYYTYVRCKAGSYPTDYADGIEVHSGTGASDTVEGLDPGTTYYFRAWSRAYDGEWGPYSDGYDSDTEETLPDPALPTVTTEAASDVGQTTATGNGTITATGNGTCDKRGIVYGTASQGDPGNVAPGASGYDGFEEQSDSYGVEAFTRSLTGLIPGTTYFARAYAHNETGYSYGSEVSFDTKPAPGGSSTTQAAKALLE